MGWKDLLKNDENEFVVYPWCGGRSIQTNDRGWTIKGNLPREHGWYKFNVQTRIAELDSDNDPQPENLSYHKTGYLVGDRFVPDDVNVHPEINELTKQFERINLLEPGLDRFVRIKAGRTFEYGPLIYEGEEFPLGPEEDVLNAYLEEQSSVNHIQNVPPALDCAFRYETWRRAEMVRIREEERVRREQEERRRRIQETLGDGELRRQLALEDFGEAARAALAVGGAEYLDHRRSHNREEMIVRFRYSGRRFECVCNARTLRIIDSGICLVGNDRLFTLESLPPVIGEAIDEDVLHVFRHA